MYLAVVWLAKKCAFYFIIFHLASSIDQGEFTMRQESYEL